MNKRNWIALVFDILYYYNVEHEQLMGMLYSKSN
jgi:hypothetical protein